MKKLIIAAIIVLFAATISQAVTIDELFAKLKDNQGKIKDMQADVTTKMVSNAKGMKEMTQKGHIWTKGKDKSKMEITSPQKQISITNGTKVAMIMPDTGQKYVQDLSKTPEGQKQESGQMDFEKAKEKFNFSVKDVSRGFLIIGFPKGNNKLMGKMEVFVNSSKLVPEEIRVFGANNKKISDTRIEYKEIKGILVASRSFSMVSMPNGEMKIDMVYDNIKINENIPDSVFDVN
ncbi:hypothetical protein A2276_02425 [candidate division WOR-1 bacterium RIFOXYA12_FULL_43_27]|uniref:Outer membrane lipoprotein carrier protein LolA n=1 Tax=candidate division WOR-1 bacterium RIFOXYC2_FULL_46_14 TaxID=1802587 RepID=A0A1F4U7Y6_UNCSA|nr:MAG: hypothetical protein A2276_02425 [candidate division WOR-1 bacterium RIFOXYA12_FULL_43_27]OGC19433.1 MAG: hypothetical protein A2292_01905 [candidate division WOR-1 bacterium RIFOXYB2_FULL_46_45]OGC30422.1 MAG: hypothetical protein A2232_01905 [candidate division WOR-1 bacterium RIFOXYA2_FULL_46_56]OGC41022.1 MAG: hypothetical protein A2438_01905 [candidate division WOR-1 bacterium RIFOXYC2_FULL_46_14]